MTDEASEAEVPGRVLLTGTRRGNGAFLRRELVAVLAALCMLLPLAAVSANPVQAAGVPAPTVTSPPVTHAKRGSIVSGTAPAGSTVVLQNHTQWTPADDYSIVRTVRANSAGRWARAFRLDVDYRVFATVGGASQSRSATMLFTSAPLPPPPPLRLVAQWRMEDTGRTMRDASGGGRHGTLRGSVEARQPGASGYGYRFPSRPSYVTVPSSTALDPGTSRFSVTARVRFRALPPGGDVNTLDIVRKGVTTTPGGDWKLEILASGAPHCLFRGSAGQSAVVGSRSLADGSWHTVTCTLTPTSVTVVVDGVSTWAAARTGRISNTEPVLLGVKNTLGHDQYLGFLDDVSVAKG